MPILSTHVTDDEWRRITEGVAVVSIDGVVPAAPVTPAVPRLASRHANLANADSGMGLAGRNLRDGMELIISDDRTDSLIIVQARSNMAMQRVTARVGMRGNWDAHRRPVRWTTSELPALSVSPAAMARRKAEYARRRPEHCCRSCGSLHSVARSCN